MERRPAIQRVPLSVIFLVFHAADISAAVLTGPRNRTRSGSQSRMRSLPGSTALPADSRFFRNPVTVPKNLRPQVYAAPPAEMRPQVYASPANLATAPTLANVSDKSKSLPAPAKQASPQATSEPQALPASVVPVLDRPIHISLPPEPLVTTVQLVNPNSLRFNTQAATKWAKQEFGIEPPTSVDIAEVAGRIHANRGTHHQMPNLKDLARYYEELAGRYFDGSFLRSATGINPDAIGLVGFSGAADLQAAPELPEYLQTADPEDAVFFARVVQEAQDSEAAREVLGDIERHYRRTGEPIVIAVAPEDSDASYDGGASKLLTITPEVKAQSPRRVVSTLIHELVHRRQENEGVFARFAIEIEQEAILIQLMVDRELGLGTNGPANMTYHRIYQRLTWSARSYLAGVKAEYDDKKEKEFYTIIDKSFDDAERLIIKGRRETEMLLAESEQNLAERRKTHRFLQQAGYPQSMVDAYYRINVKDEMGNVALYKWWIQLYNKELRMIQTKEGRRKYVAFARRVIQLAQRQHKLVARADAARSAPTPLRLPRVERVNEKRAAPKEEPVTYWWSVPLIQAQATRLPNWVATPHKESKAWLAAAIAEMKKSKAGRALIKKAEQAFTDRGRPFVVEVIFTGNDRVSDYDEVYDVIQIPRTNARWPIEQGATVLIENLYLAVTSDGVPAYALEREVEGHIAVFRHMDETGAALPQNHYLELARQKLITEGFEAFLAYLDKSFSIMPLYSRVGNTQFRADLTQLEAYSLGNIAEEEKIIARARRTMQLMKQVHASPKAIAAVRGTEIYDRQAQIIRERARIAEVKRDLRMVNPDHDISDVVAYTKRVIREAETYAKSINAFDPPEQ